MLFFFFPFLIFWTAWPKSAANKDIVNNVPLCACVCVCLRGCTRACALFFNRPTAANIFVFWFHRLYAPLFIILPHSNSQELKEQKETKTRKTKSTRTKGNQKNKKEIQKQENKTLEQSQYLFPLHFHSHLYFIIPERIFMLVKVNLNPGLVHFFSRLDARHFQHCSRHRQLLRSLHDFCGTALLDYI